MSEFNIVHLFLESAKKFPDKAAIITKDETISFAGLEKSVQETSHYLLSKGICKGDRVLLFVPMSTDLYRIVLALFNIGATAVFLDEWVSRKRLEACCEVADCKAFVGIFKARMLSWFSPGLRKIPIRLGTSYRKTAPQQIAPTSDSDTALITFTTGSTGTPKAAKRTHGFLRKQFGALITIIDPQPGDVDMPVLPVVLLINLGAGCTSVITPWKASKPEQLDVEQVFSQINEHQVTRMVSSPFFVRQLANYAARRPVSVPSLKKIFTGGAPVFPSEAELFVKAFPEARTEIVYGSTEAEPISSINATELTKEKNSLQKGLKAGFPDKSATVKIIGIQTGIVSPESAEDFRKLWLNPGEIGEIIVSGEHVLQEYFNNEAALKLNKIWVDGTCWHRTGDSGYLDGNGMIYLTGRAASLIFLNGETISPFLYESKLQAIEGVELGTVLLVDGKLTVIIEVRPGTNKESVSQAVHGSELKAGEIRFIAKMPTDPRHNSKIDYGKLITGNQGNQ